MSISYKPVGVTAAVVPGIDGHLSKVKSHLQVKVTLSTPFQWKTASLNSLQKAILEGFFQLQLSETAN